MPPYFPNVPAANQRINASQPQIQTDFQALQAIIGQDHVTFTDATVANWGKHNVIEFVSTPAATIPVPGAHEIDVFNKVPLAPFPLTGLDELFIKRVGLEVPITAASQFRQNVSGNTNWFYLPCGLVVKYGANTTAQVGVFPPQVLVTINLNQIGIGPIFAPPYINLPFTFATTSNHGAVPVSCDASAISLTLYSGVPTLVSWITIGQV